MPRSRVQRWLLVYFGVFALIGQLMLPMVHAQSLARHGGNPLYAAFCGEVAPQRLGALQQQLVASLQQDVAAQDTQHPAKSGCPLCVSLHAAQLVVSSGVDLPHLRTTIVPLPVVTVAGLTPPATRPPPSRGPPLYS